MKKVLALFLYMAIVATLAACGGGSEADKAYDNWLKNTMPKMDQADTDYNTKVAEVGQGDLETARTIMTEYYTALKAGVDELAAIDANALTGNRKNDAPGYLSALQAKVRQCEEALAMYDQQGQPQEQGQEQGQGAANEEALYTAARYLLENAQAAFVGVTDAGDDAVFVQTADMAALAIADANMKSISFVGKYEEDGSGGITIYDEWSGLAFSMVVAETLDSGFIGDCGEAGQIEFHATNVETAITALLMINGFTEPIA